MGSENSNGYEGKQTANSVEANK